MSSMDMGVDMDVDKAIQQMHRRLSAGMELEESTGRRTGKISLFGEEKTQEAKATWLSKNKPSKSAPEEHHFAKIVPLVRLSA